MRLLSFLLISTILILLFPTALLFVLPGEVSSKLIWLGLLTPVIWTGAMLYSYWDHNKRRPLELMICVIIGSALIIFFSYLA